MSDQIAYGVQSDCVRCPLIFVQLMCSCSFDRMFVFLCSDFVVCELFAQIIPRKALFATHNIFRRAATYDVAALVATFRSQVDNVVAALYHVEVVLDYHDRVSSCYKGVERIEQAMDIMEVLTRCWLIKDEHRRLLALLADEVGEFYALVLAA